MKKISSELYPQYTVELYKVDKCSLCSRLYLYKHQPLEKCPHCGSRYELYMYILEVPDDKTVKDIFGDV